MGQAKERKKRLGEWYDKPIGPGHPDFVPPKKPQSVAATETTQEEPMHPESTRDPSGIDEVREDGLHAPQTTSRPSHRIQGRRLPGLFALAMLGMIAASGIDLGPAPPPRPKKR